MNKKLLALAVAGAFVAPVAATADTGNVTIYGVMSASVNQVNPGRAGSNAAGQNVMQVNDDSSRLGFKGTEALGNGLNAVWQIESAITSEGGTASSTTTTAGRTDGTLNSRNTFVGLSGGFGTAIIGRHDTPYKLSTRGFDVFADGIGDNRSIMGGGAGGSAASSFNGVVVNASAFTGGNSATTLAPGAGASFDGRQSNVIAYISPTVNGVTGAIGYVAGSETATNSGNQKGNALSAMVNYANGPIYAALAYEKHNIGQAATGNISDPSGTSNTTGLLANTSEKAWKLGLGYTMDALKLGFAYEKTSDDFGTVFNVGGTGNSNGSTSYFGHNAYYLSAAYTMGANVLKLAYTKAGDQDRASNTGAKQVTIGMDHNFSKRTKLYALYTKLNNDSGAFYSLVGGSNGGVGGASFTANAGTAPTAVVGFDNDPSAVSIGVRHEF